MSYFSHEDVAEASRGIDPRWLRGVPVVWQEQIEGFDRELRVLWSNRVGAWAVVRRGTWSQEFEDGRLVGWTIVKWFPSGSRPDDMIHALSQMVDSHKFSSAEEANAWATKQAAEGKKKMREELRERDSEFANEFFKHEDAGVRDYERERKESLDATKRSTAKTKVTLGPISTVQTAGA